MSVVKQIKYYLSCRINKNDVRWREHRIMMMLNIYEYDIGICNCCSSKDLCREAIRVNFLR